MGKLEKEIAMLKSMVDLQEARIIKLETEEAREAKEGTIRPGTRRGRQPKTEETKGTE